jgi:hypothetical protein
MYVKIKKHFSHQKYLGTLKLSKQKSSENFPNFFLYSVQGAWCDGRR